MALRDKEIYDTGRDNAAGSSPACKLQDSVANVAARCEITAVWQAEKKGEGKILQRTKLGKMGSASSLIVLVLQFVII